MALDPYALCPGGRDKKIRFCCPDMIKELEQIDRLLESNQGGACLSFLENLEKEHPDCACLTAAKLTLYRQAQRWDDAFELSRAFLEREPENPIAASEYAMSLAVEGRFPQAISVLVDAYQQSKDGTIHSALIRTTLQVGAILLSAGLVIPVVALANRLKTFPISQEQANTLLYQASSLVDIPLLLRDMILDQGCPDDFPGRREFEDAVEQLALLRWKNGLATLESLACYADSWPYIWRIIAVVRLWLMDNEPGMDALRTFASLPGVPLEDAVDAEATRLLIDPDAMGDMMSILGLEYKVVDVDKTREILLSTPRFQSMPFDPQVFTQRDMPAPKGMYLVLDRPLAATGTELTLDTVSSQIGTCLLFGRETDRDARLEFMEVLDFDQAPLEAFLRETFGDAVDPDPIKVDGNRRISRTLATIQYRFRYRPETLPSPQVRNRLESDYYEKTFGDSWCGRPLGLLDGKTPSEASGDPAYRIRVSAAIEVLESWMNEEQGIIATNRLRERLGLPIHGPIAVPEGDDEAMLALLDDYPVWRWYRFDADKLTTEALVEGIQIVAVMKEPRATSRFAKALLRRPLTEVPAPVRFLALESLVSIALSEWDNETALEWIEKGKNEARELNFPDATLCLQEISIYLTSGKHLEQANAAIQDLVRRYGRDQRVMQALHQMFVRLGLMNPDGTPTVAPRSQAVEPEPPSAGGLWTPESDLPPTTDGGSKLWTPD